MQFKFAFALGFTTLATLAVATPTSRGEPASSCSTLSLLCCQATGYSTDPVIAQLLTILGIIVPPDVLVGITCTPITLGEPTCNAQAVCCEDNSYNGIVAVGCIPVTL